MTSDNRSMISLGCRVNDSYVDSGHTHADAKTSGSKSVKLFFRDMTFLIDKIAS